MTETKKLRIKYNKTGCIGVGVCSNVAPAHFILDESNFADLVENGNKVDKKDGDFAVKEVDADEIMQKELMQAANGCPVDVIEVYDAESGKKLWPIRD